MNVDNWFLPALYIPRNRNRRAVAERRSERPVGAWQPGSAVVRARAATCRLQPRYLCSSHSQWIPTREPSMSLYATPNTALAPSPSIHHGLRSTAPSQLTRYSAAQLFTTHVSRSRIREHTPLIFVTLNRNLNFCGFKSNFVILYILNDADKHVTLAVIIKLNVKHLIKDWIGECNKWFGQ